MKYRVFLDQVGPCVVSPWLPTFEEAEALPMASQATAGIWAEEVLADGRISWACHEKLDGEFWETMGGVTPPGVPVCRPWDAPETCGEVGRN